MEWLDFMPSPGWVEQEWMAWLVVASLMGLALTSVFIPIIPGQLMIIASGGLLWWFLGERSSLGRWSFFALIFIYGISQYLEFFSGAMGSKWFGGSKWGAFGAVFGSLVGLFFLPIGILLGPLIGAIIFELLFARRKIGESAASGIGSVVGSLAGMLIRLSLILTMVAYLFCDAFIF